MQNSGKIIALDLGQKKTGLSISDKTQSVAFIRDELRHTSVKELLDQLSRLILEEEITCIVLGMPKNMSGEDTDQTEITNAFAIELENTFKLPIILIDERLSTKQTNSDSEAAQLLLNTYLSQKNNA